MQKCTFYAHSRPAATLGAFSTPRRPPAGLYARGAAALDVTPCKVPPFMLHLLNLSRARRDYGRPAAESDTGNAIDAHNNGKNAINNDFL